ncbi:hypothetical protein C7974DRAFT_417961 [Boeremia exigua]|uniref:uncharacterized protein n=1 Tax=Boeremia exigua TaxID=749465 RepID=UPI001E8DCE67|nr:uncharacterized protein C7974DRAFT_417961 [Boeremia exigua]KAH6614242.1 hypothetical protein C7974DRAFT_417961 [Boeremia exigua]
MKPTTLLVTLAATATALPRLHPHKRASQIIPVVVGGPQDTFVPNSITAAVGDIVQFQFSNGNHTVTQSTVDQACTPMDAGVHSGHIPFKDGQADVGTFNMPVTSTEPMFLYCATGPHCQEGQVMVINPVNAQQVADYAKLSQATEKSTDGGAPVGGAAGKIALDQAAFTPAPPQDAAAAPPPAAAAPPAEAPPAAGNATAPAETTPAEPPVVAPPAETSAAEAAPAESAAPPAETTAAVPPEPTSFVFLSK